MFILNKKFATSLPEFLPFIPDPHRKWDANNNCQACEQRVSTTVSKSDIHVLTEEGEYKCEEGVEDGGSRDSTGREGKGVHEIQSC
jgi:hypothetical protein